MLRQEKLDIFHTNTDTMSKNIDTTLLEVEILKYFYIILNYVIQIPKRKWYKGYQMLQKSILPVLVHISTIPALSALGNSNKRNITVKISEH